MVKDDGKQWLIEVVQSLTGQLKDNREQINLLWQAMGDTSKAHMTCREEVFKNLANLDKRIEVAMIKLGLLISVVITLGQYLLNHLLGK